MSGHGPLRTARLAAPLPLRLEGPLRPTPSAGVGSEAEHRIRADRTTTPSSLLTANPSLGNRRRRRDEPAQLRALSDCGAREPAAGTATATGGISNIANVPGGAGNDILVGKVAANMLLGGAAPSRIRSKTRETISPLGRGVPASLLTEHFKVLRARRMPRRCSHQGRASVDEVAARVEHFVQRIEFAGYQRQFHQERADLA